VKLSDADRIHAAECLGIARDELALHNQLTKEIAHDRKATAKRLEARIEKLTREVTTGETETESEQLSIEGA
jgi:hypothetical protein